ncbi:MAG: hypothetical protein GY754_09280 [bacterium]|nr:hypothetical protein [bacterium]
MRTLFARNHATIYPKKGVFLAGPTPPSGEMQEGWRRKLISKLQEDYKFNNDCIVVSPEPYDGKWNSIISQSGPPNESAENDQIGWELQYLNLCDITAFWLPVYWDAKAAENYPANIGPTTRWEFGMILERYLNSAGRKKLILGGPEDAQSIGWVKHVSRHYDIPFHSLSAASKEKLVSDNFVKAIAEALGNVTGS